MKILLRFLFIVLLAFLYLNSNAQTCGTCSINITSLDSSSYTINSGQTFCIDTTGNFVGTVILNGGSICIKGIFNPGNFTFNSGTISNYGNISFNNSLSIGNNVQLNNNSDAVININGILTMNGGSFTNNGVVNVDQNISNGAGSIVNTSIINCVQISGGGTLNNSGIINSN